MLFKHILFVFLFLNLAYVVNGQNLKINNPVKCNVQLADKGDFKTLDKNSSSPLMIFISVDKKKQTDENYLKIARYFEARYCQERELYVGIFDSKEHYKIWLIPQPERPKIEGLARALYYLNRDKEEESFSINAIIDGKLKPRYLLLK